VRIKKGLDCGGRGESEKIPALKYAFINTIPIVSKTVRLFKLIFSQQHKKFGLRNKVVAFYNTTKIVLLLIGVCQRRTDH